MKWVLLVLVTLMWADLSAQEDIFLQANAAYKSKDYSAAISSYENLLDQSLHSKELYYNLGNAYYQNGNIAKSILNYERALKLNPGNKETEKNLSIVRQQVELQVLPVPDFFLARWWRSFVTILKPNTWVGFQFISGMLLVLGIFLWKFKSGHPQAGNGTKLALLSLLSIPLFYFAGAGSQHYFDGNDTAVMMHQGLLLEEPHDGSEELETLTPGVKMRILDKVDQWYQVSLLNKEQGWVKLESAEVI